MSIVVTGAVALLTCGNVPADAGPVLLASFDVATNGGHAPESDPQLEFILQLPSAFPPTDFFGLGNGMDVFWQDGEQGYFDFSAANDPGFSEFAVHATDGIDSFFMLWTLFPSGGGDGRLGTESDLFGTSTDLMGKNLDFVRLVVRDIRLDPYVPDPVDFPDITGFRFEADLTYEFYGTPIPEPGTLILATLGSVIIIWRRPSVVFCNERRYQ